MGEPWANHSGVIPGRGAKDLLTAMIGWSGRRDSNPRPSPWQGHGSGPPARLSPAERALLRRLFRPVRRVRPSPVADVQHVKPLPTRVPSRSGDLGVRDGTRPRPVPHPERTRHHVFVLTTCRDGHGRARAWTSSEGLGPNPAGRHTPHIALGDHGHERLLPPDGADPTTSWGSRSHAAASGSPARSTILAGLARSAIPGGHGRRSR